MDQQQTSTNTPKLPEVEVVGVPYTELSPQQQAWIDYNVLQGVVIESDGDMHKVTVQQFADTLNVDRTTLYGWSKKIPNFWDLVNDRRKEMFKGARTAKVWNAVFLSATVKLNTQAQALWLSNADPNFRMPQQKVEHEMGNSWAALLAAKRNKKVIEGQSGSSTTQ